MAPLKLLVLGPPRLERAGRLVELPLRRATALLVYLAVTDRPQAREVLAGQLWPETDEREARGRLRRTLHRLSETLGDEALLVEGDTLRLAPAANLWLDSRAFEAHADAALRAGPGAETPHPEPLAHATKAATLYADDFLAGFTLPDSAAWDEWQFLQREHLRQVCGRVLEWLVGAHRARGESEAVIGYARRWLALDPLHEPAHRALMQAYAVAGQQAAALRQYQECARLLEAELGVTPEEATTTLHEAIRTRRLGPPAAAPPAGPPPAPAEDGTLPSTAAPTSASPRADLRHSLPSQPTPLIGRDREQALIAARLLQEGTRLLTLTGPGGVGKTRLALQVAADLADRFEGGVSFVGLAPVLDPALVGSAIAQALGVGEAAGRPLLESVKDHLREQELLLLLDNFEHLLAAAPLVADLVATCRRLKVLITSRAVLHLRGEKEFAVPPLALPDREHLLSLPALAGYAAVALFVERARDARPDFAITGENAPVLAEICRRLDGLPLAIELAAARVKLLPPEALLARLEHRLALLTGGPRDLPARQQTLRDTIAWSHDLLDDLERALYRRLGVFVGGCDLGAAEAVCGPRTDEAAASPALTVLDGLASLVDKSLVHQEEGPDGDRRFQMLETIREFGCEQLEAAGEAGATRRRHAEYLLALAEAADGELHGAEQADWLGRLLRDQDNLRAALSWTFGPGGDAEMGMRLAVALTWFWWLSSNFSEGRAWLQRALQACGDAPAALRAQALTGIGQLTRAQGDYEPAALLAEASAELAREAGERREEGRALVLLLSVARARGNYEAAIRLGEAVLALTRELDESWTRSLALYWLGFMARTCGDLEQATALQHESLALRQTSGDPWGIAWSLHDLGLVALARGEYEQAEATFAESLAIHRAISHARGIAWALNSLGLVAHARGDADRAEALIRESLALRWEQGDKLGAAECLDALASVAAAAAERRGQAAAHRAGQLLGATDALREAIGTPRWPAEMAQYERVRSAVLATVGEAGFAAAWADGRTRSLEQTVEDALADSEVNEGLRGGDRIGDFG